MNDLVIYALETACFDCISRPICRSKSECHHVYSDKVDKKTFRVLASEASETEIRVALSIVLARHQEQAFDIFQDVLVDNKLLRTPRQLSALLIDISKDANKELIRLLLSLGADPNFDNGKALKNALLFGNLDTVRILAKHTSREILESLSPEGIHEVKWAIILSALEGETT